LEEEFGKKTNKQTNLMLSCTSSLSSISSGGKFSLKFFVLTNKQIQDVTRVWIVRGCSSLFSKQYLPLSTVM
jgi:hypothetical protein